MASLLAVWGSRFCQGVLWSCWAALRWEGLIAKVYSSVGYNTEWMGFFWLWGRFCQLDALSPKPNRHEQSWVLVSPWGCLGTLPRADLMPWDVLSPQMHSQCFTKPFWFFYLPHTDCVCATMGVLNLVIDSRFKAGVGNEETQIYHWVLGSYEA